jgi:hypothetical protein
MESSARLVRACSEKIIAVCLNLTKDGVHRLVAAPGGLAVLRFRIFLVADIELARALRMCMGGRLA